MARIDYEKFARTARTVDEYEKMVEREVARTGESLDVSRLVTAWSDKETKKMFGGGEEITGGETAGQIFGKGLQRTSLGGGKGEQGEIFDVFELLYNYNEGRLRTGEEALKKFFTGFANSVRLQLTQEAELLEELNRRAGMTGDLSRQFRREIFQAYPDAIRLGFAFEDVKESMSTLINDAGRFKLVSSETISSIALTGRAFFDSMTEAAAAIAPFQNVSRGASDAMEAINKAGESSLQLGLNSRETVKRLVENVDKLNSFGFKNGIEGLTKMIQKAQALRMDLNLAFKLADEVMDPSKALSLAANLQVIGGALGDFNDPIKMMWMATNNVEGLQDALAGSLESLTTFNSQTGVFEVTGADLRRLRAMATELGMDYRELGNIAVQSAQRTAAAGELMTSGLVFSDEGDKEFLTNLAQMEKGKMVIEVPADLRSKLKLDQDQTKIAIGDLSQEQANAILQFRDEFKEMKAEDIAREQFTAVDNIRKDVSFLAAKARVEAGKEIGDILKLVPRDVAEKFGAVMNKIGGEFDKLSDKGGIVGAGKELFKSFKGEVTTLNPPTTTTSTATTVPPTSTEVKTSAANKAADIERQRKTYEDLETLLKNSYQTAKPNEQQSISTREQQSVTPLKSLPTPEKVTTVNINRTIKITSDVSSDFVMSHVRKDQFFKQITDDRDYTNANVGDGFFS